MSLALVAILSIAKSQTYEDCGSSAIITGNNGVSLSIGADFDNEMIQISITGPSTRWFGYGFGTTGMNNAYAITAEEDDSGSYTVIERTLSTSNYPGAELTASGTITTLDSSTATITYERAFSVSNGGYDFTDLFTCQTDTVNIIAAYGKANTLTMSKHAGAESGEQFTRTCDCPTSSPTTSDPTPQPTTADPTTSDPTTFEPTTSEPTPQPTTSEPTTADPTLPPGQTDMPTTSKPTDDPTTAEPTGGPSVDPTIDPTIDPTMNPTTFQPTTANPTTSAPTIVDGVYEECATSDVLEGVSLTIGKDEENEMVKISITGPNEGWFGYGFGSDTMIGSYSVTAEGDGFDIIERTLTAKNNPPGDILSSSGEISTRVNGTMVTVSLMRPWMVSEKDVFDFTSFMNCEVGSISMIAARSDNNRDMSIHSDYEGYGILTRLSSCNCTGSLPVDPTTGSANDISNLFFMTFILCVSIYFIL